MSEHNHKKNDKRVKKDFREIRRHKRKEKDREIKEKRRNPEEHKKSKKGAFRFWILIISVGIFMVIFRENLDPVFNSLILGFEEFLSDFEILYSIYSHIKSSITAQNMLGIGYIMFFLSLFFVPAPIEAVFLGFMFTPMNPLYLILISSIASTLGHMVNFIVGVLFGKRILKKSDHGGSRFIEWFRRSEGIILAVFNYFPLPSQPLSVVFGFAKYSFTKFTMITFIARTLKFVSLVLLFEYARPLIESIPLI